MEAGDYGFPITPEQFSWIGSIMNIGAAVVCIPIGLIMNMIGRKFAMLGLVLPFILGWALLIWANNVETMIAGRFFLGIAGGAFCVTAPAYTGEIASKEIRGILGSFFQLMITIGILFAYAVGAGVDAFYLSIICAIIPLIFGVVFVFMPESPTYLVSKDKSDKAVDAIRWLRGDQYDANSELSQLQTDFQESKAVKVSLLRAFGRPASIRAMTIAIGLMFFQQVSGINAVIFYSTDIFRDANTGIEAEMATIIIGVIQVVATFVATSVVDKLGRRILLLASGSLMAVCTIALGAYFFIKDQDTARVENMGWLPVVALCIFMVMFSFGYGPVPWLMMGELFASDIKGVAGAIAGTTNWLLAFLITKTFGNLRTAIGGGETFWLFSGLTIVGTVFVFFFCPETKGKSLTEIQVILSGGRSESTMEIAPAATITNTSQPSDEEKESERY